MSKKGSIERGAKYAHYMKFSLELKERYEEDFKNFPDMKKDYDLYLASIKSPEKKK